MNKFLPWPEAFDANEWFIIASGVFYLVLILSLPKRFPMVICLTLWLFNTTLAKSADYTIAAALPYDLYDYNDSGKLEFFDEVLQYLLYPQVGYLMMYMYDLWRPTSYKLVAFVLALAGFSVWYEWSSVQAHVFTYKGWSLRYSANSYLILIPLNIWFLDTMKNWWNRLERKNL
ncbi:hypothetical protein [Tumebacillus flagellatus]|uniref:Uncharacterized protein n=1 Tax=Tumebacillus flagellatus TaxID=1157490 RepID=A0A074LL79_9BACL|nr:hypothetical protein [Tumebacillus flagellatus]KEO81320.1 hypothetical protein EL26_21445 [Tumebacillus flagellatus]